MPNSIKLLYQNCTLSEGMRCDSIAHNEHNRIILQAHRERLKIHKTLLETKKEDLRYHNTIARILSELDDLHNANASLISHYEERRIGGLLFKKKRSNYETIEIIKESNQAMKSLAVINNGLKLKIQKAKIRTLK